MKCMRPTGEKCAGPKCLRLHRASSIPPSKEAPTLTGYPQTLQSQRTAYDRRAGQKVVRMSSPSTLQKAYRTASELDFIHLRSITERLCETLEQYAWDFSHLTPRVRQLKMLLTPPPAPHKRPRVREGRTLFGVPRLSTCGQALLCEPPCGPQADARGQPQHAGRRAGDGFLRPLPLRLHTEMRSGLLAGAFHLPPSDEPCQALGRRGCQLRREQRLGRTLLLRVTDQPPTDGPRWHASVIPDARPRHACDHALWRPIPVPPRHLLPLRLPLRCHGLQRRQTRALLARTPPLPGVSRWCGLIPCRIQTQSCHHRDRIAPSLQPCQGADTAVGGDDARAVGQPACDPQQPRPGTIRQRAVGAPTLLAVTLRWAQRGLQWQRPHTGSPRYRDQQHQAQPAPAAGFDAVRLRRAYRLTIDALRGALLAPSPLDRVVQSQYDCPSGSKRADPQAEQDLTGSAARPEGTVQPPMVMLKLRVLAQAQDAPGRGHGACARREDGTQKQDWRVVEHRLREEGRACYYQSDKLAGHGSASTDLFLAAIVSSFPALRFVFKDQKWIKSSSEMRVL